MAVAGAHDDDDRGISKAWPFTLGFTMIIGAMVWFCLGWAKLDATKTKEDPEGHPLFGHFPIFWSLILGAFALWIIGGIMNARIRREYYGTN